jgi:hypothetical protein
MGIRSFTLLHKLGIINSNVQCGGHAVAPGRKLLVCISVLILLLFWVFVAVVEDEILFSIFYWWCSSTEK